MKKVICVIILTVIITFGGFLCLRSNKSTPEKTIKEFEKALNNDDINGMLECLEPTISNSTHIFLDKIDEYTNEKFSTVIDLIPFISVISKKDIFPEYDIDNISSNIDGNYAIVKISVCKKDNEDFKTYYFNVYLTKLNDKWYILYAIPLEEEGLEV